MDYTASAQLALDQITDKGRSITLYKLDGTVADNTKPWRGKAVQTKTSPVNTVGLFVTPDTSIPTKSRGLAFDWIDQELLKRVRHVCVVPAMGNPDLEPYSLLSDGGRDFGIEWGQCFKPGDTAIFYVFGLAE